MSDLSSRCTQSTRKCAIVPDIIELEISPATDLRLSKIWYDPVKSYKFKQIENIAIPVKVGCKVLILCMHTHVTLEVCDMDVLEVDEFHLYPSVLSVRYPHLPYYPE